MLAGRRYNAVLLPEGHGVRSQAAFEWSRSSSMRRSDASIAVCAWVSQTAGNSQLVVGSVFRRCRTGNRRETGMDRPVLLSLGLAKRKAVGSSR